MRKETKKGMFKDDENAIHRAQSTVGKEMGSVSLYVTLFYGLNVSPSKFT